MKTSFLFAALAALFIGCDARVSTPPADSNTTIINPPAADKKVETNTTIVNPPAAEKKVETKTTETTN